jgi:hypothetical protein
MWVINFSHHAVSYEGRGPNGKAALHLAYASDKASMEFLRDAVRDVRSLSSSLHAGDLDRHPAVDEAMYWYIRVELAKAFSIPHEDNLSPPGIPVALLGRRRCVNEFPYVRLCGSFTVSISTMIGLSCDSSSRA